jgi:hypothetical protein
MTEEQERARQFTLDLNCDEYEVRAASFSPGREGEGGLFSCSIAPVTDETAAALAQAVQSHTLIRLSFSEHPLLLDLVTLERKAPQSVRIVGHIVRPATKGTA